MDCYFGSCLIDPSQATDKTSVVAFQIPQVGIHFKAPFAAVDSMHSDLASLLALLEFIDSNQKYFSNRTYQIYGTNQSLIQLFEQPEAIPPIFVSLMDRAFEYRARYHFSLHWIPIQESPLTEDLLD